MSLLFMLLLLVALAETETALLSYFVHINHFCIPEMKDMIQQNVCLGNVGSGKCHARNCLLGRCWFRELSVWGTVLRETVSWVTARPGNVCRGVVLEPYLYIFILLICIYIYSYMFKITVRFTSLCI